MSVYAEADVITKIYSAIRRQSKQKCEAIVINFFHRAIRITNAFLSIFGIRIAKGEAGKIWHHPQTPDLLHSEATPRATYSPWLNDEEFVNCYIQIKSNTLVDVYRCYELWQLAKQLAFVEGDYLEVGVWRGGTGCLLAKAVEGADKKIFLADTFSGIVKAGANDVFYKGGEHSDTSESVVLALAGKLGLSNVHILKGVFPQETGMVPQRRIALVHCDVDVYVSAKDVVDWALPRLAPNGMIVFDDYGFSGCEGVTKLVNELRSQKEFIILHNLNGHAILIKRI